jgi:hypothetical protein
MYQTEGGATIPEIKYSRKNFCRERTWLFNRLLRRPDRPGGLSGDADLGLPLPPKKAEVTKTIVPDSEG